MQTGVKFPSHSTSSTARQIIAAALATVDEPGARAVEHDTNWRRGYLDHFVRLVHAGTLGAEESVAIATAGLQRTHELMQFNEAGLDSVFDMDVAHEFTTTEISGGGLAETELSVPHQGQRLRGDDLRRQLQDWVDRGIMTESAAAAITEVQANPDWLRLDGDTVVALGAGAELGPYRSLLTWGADVVAIDLAREDVQERLGRHAVESAGRVRLPTSTHGTGADLLHELPALARWLDQLDGRLVLGNYCYADGGTHVRLAVAGDVLGQHLLAQRPDTALAFLATPTDAFAVPADAVDRANRAHAEGSRVLRTPFRVVSGGRLLQRNYPPQVDIGICDSLVPQQGPNYALAKRLHRWRATVAAHAGQRVSLNVAPATRTHSVVKNKALAAAYAGAHRFGVEVFDPSTSNVLMAALLVHDLRAERPRLANPWEEEAHGAVHGGLWTTAYHPRSALGLAAILGMGAIRG